MEQRSDGFVGVFDSGLGGTSVLRSLVDELPHEDFHYFGDSANAPYGEKTEEQVLALSRTIVERFLDGGAKAIVIACNTATSVAAAALRASHPDVPIVGIEPALKPAARALPHGRILVMATEVTLRLEKYHELARAWGGECEVISVPCPGLAARIERGDLDAPDLAEMIDGLVGRYAGTVDAVVLGCTHYPFVRPLISRVLGEGVRFFDGGAGTARQLRSRLAQEGLLAERNRAGRVEFASSLSTPEELALYERFFSLPL
ncbi:glutamate racemase [Thermophilibacter provencensis]|uniref:Glutamate racemase n=1 Tax=Thermophilibacter provencensis TaxID=1852386 RepID=A0ABT7V3H3_9ACTN|nr:glutamate racemase [Thermophilibacter provencensis]MDM8271130.1 glutamate racemase [Thermophilibacter provencensis]